MATGPETLPALASQPIEVAALGRPLFPGMLYDCRKDTFIPAVTLWDKKSLREDLDTYQKPMTDLKFSSSDSLSSKSSLLDVSASLKASFLGGLVEVEGSAKFLRDTKSSNQQSRVTMYYSETTRFDQLTMTQLGQITYPQVFDQKTATHVVTAVLYGAQAVMVFDRTFSEEEERQEIEGELDIMVRKIPLFSIEGQGAVNMTDAQMKVAEKTSCTFYGDVHLEQNPTTYTEALEVYKKLPTILKEKPKNAVPIKVWLYPLSQLDTKAARLEREITTHLVSNTEDIIEGLGEVQRTCNDLSRKALVNVFNDFKGRLKSFQSSLNIYQTVLLKAVGKVLPAIRGGEMEQKSLEDILKIHYSSPFKADMLNQWLDHATAELNLLSSHTETLKGIKTVDSNRLKTILFDSNIDVVVCLTLTSLKYEDPDLSNLKKFLESDAFKGLDVVNLQSSTVASVRKGFNDPDVTSKMRENLSLFKSFSEANKDEKRYRFVISAISDPSSPGSSIYLYEKGKLTDKQFQPVSKPPPPEVKEILERSVSLKLQKSPTGETVQFRVEYQQVKADSGPEEQWIIINTADEDLTLTGLKSGKQYLIRYRIVGKVGVSEASGTIGPIQSSEISAGPDNPVIRVLLLGRKGSGKSSSGNTILGERKFKVKKQHVAEVCEEVNQTGEKQVCVIDCPDLLDPDLNKEKLKKMKDQLISRCSSGLSAVLLTVPVEEPVENEEEILDYIKRLFGPEVQKYIMILFTHGDELEDLDQTIEEHLQDHEDLQRLLTECGGRFHCFNNRSKSGDQVPELLQKIEGMMTDNRGKFVTAKMKRSDRRDDPGVNFSSEDPHKFGVRKDQIRLVLLGKTGSGKSATGNTIIGRNVFESTAGSNSVTKQCQAETTVRFGKKISVIDTPGLYDTVFSEEEIKTEIRKCTKHASPGPHAFLIVIKVGRFTEEEKNTIEQLKEVFGKQILKYTMIIFTHKDQLEKEKQTNQKFLQHCDPNLRKLIRSCGNRFFCIDNKSASFPQFRDLISEIEKMVEENGGKHFKHEVFERTEQYIWKMSMYHRMNKFFPLGKSNIQEPTNVTEGAVQLNQPEDIENGCCKTQ